MARNSLTAFVVLLVFGLLQVSAQEAESKNEVELPPPTHDGVYPDGINIFPSEPKTFTPMTSKAAARDKSSLPVDPLGVQPKTTTTFPYVELVTGLGVVCTV